MHHTHLKLSVKLRFTYNGIKQAWWWNRQPLGCLNIQHFPPSLFPCPLLYFPSFISYKLEWNRLKVFLEGARWHKFYAVGVEGGRGSSAISAVPLFKGCTYNWIFSLHLHLSSCPWPLNSPQENVSTSLNDPPALSCTLVSMLPLAGKLQKAAWWLSSLHRG